MPPTADHVPEPGSYTSADAKLRVAASRPPATSTLPSRSSVAVAEARLAPISPVRVQRSVGGSYSSDDRQRVPPVSASAVTAADDQHSTVTQEDGPVSHARVVHGVGRYPLARGRIEDIGYRHGVVRRPPHQSAGEQRSTVRQSDAYRAVPFDFGGSDGRPRIRRRVVDFRHPESGSRPAALEQGRVRDESAARDEHPAVCERNGAGADAGHAHLGRGRPGARCRVVYLGRRGRIVALRSDLTATESSLAADYKYPTACERRSSMVHPCLGHLSPDDCAGSVHQHYTDDQPDHQHRDNGCRGDADVASIRYERHRASASADDRGAPAHGASLRTGPRQPPRHVRRQTPHYPSQHLPGRVPAMRPGAMGMLVVVRLYLVPAVAPLAGRQPGRIEPHPPTQRPRNEAQTRVNQLVSCS